MSAVPDASASLIPPPSQPAGVIPRIYALSPIPRRLNFAGRSVAVILWLACSTLLTMSAYATPDPSGVGTHQCFGLVKCEWLAQHGYPCPMCGMTTSFAWFVRGNFLASAYVQPMGFVLALLTGMAWWATAYIAATGRPVHEMLLRTPPTFFVLPLGVLFGLAWGWKIFIHARGMDGWK